MSLSIVPSQLDTYFAIVRSHYGGWVLGRVEATVRVYNIVTLTRLGSSLALQRRSLLTLTFASALACLPFFLFLLFPRAARLIVERRAIPLRLLVIASFFHFFSLCVPSVWRLPFELAA